MVAETACPYQGRNARSNSSAHSRQAAHESRGTVHSLTSPTSVMHLLSGMPLDKYTVQRLVRGEARDAEEKVKLLRLVAEKPELWDGLEEDEIVGVLRETLTSAAGIDPVVSSLDQGLQCSPRHHCSRALSASSSMCALAEQSVWHSTCYSLGFCGVLRGDQGCCLLV